MRQHLRLDWLPGLLVARPHFELSFRREERSSSSIRTLNSGNPNSSWPISFELHSNTQCFPEPRLHRSERKQSGPKLRFELNNPLIFFLIYSSYLTSLVPNSQGGVRRYSNRSLYWLQNVHSPKRIQQASNPAPTVRIIKLGGFIGYSLGKTIRPWYIPPAKSVSGGPLNVKCHSKRLSWNWTSQSIGIQTNLQWPRVEETVWLVKFLGLLKQSLNSWKQYVKEHGNLACLHNVYCLSFLNRMKWTSSWLERGGINGKRALNETKNKAGCWPETTNQTRAEW